MGTKVMNVSIRNFEEGDLSDLVAVERALVADGRGQVCGPEDVADEGALRERLAPGPRSLRLVALHEGRLVGSAGWHRYRPQLLQHVASLDVGVHPAAQGLGLGRKLMQALVGRATREGIERLELKRQLSPAWTTDWLSDKGRARLEDYGIAPPQPAGGPDRCPRCHGPNVERLSQFGSTPCKAQWRCTDCLEPFDYFKCI